MAPGNSSLVCAEIDALPHISALIQWRIDNQFQYHLHDYSHWSKSHMLKQAKIQCQEQVQLFFYKADDRAAALARGESPKADSPRAEQADRTPGPGMPESPTRPSTPPALVPGGSQRCSSVGSASIAAAPAGPDERYSPVNLLMWIQITRQELHQARIRCESVNVIRIETELARLIARKAEIVRAIERNRRLT